MKNSQPYLLFVCMVLSLGAFASDNTNDSEQLYKTHCSSCHGNTGGMNMSKRIAPPIAAVRMHYIGPYSDKAAFVSAIVNWVEKQDARKSLMPGAIRRFGIMPPVKIARDDVEKIAAYIYKGSIEKPVGFDEHVEQRHGKYRK